MLITCRYCGRVHERSYDCGKKPKKKYRKGYVRRDEREAAFRRTEAWKKKSLEIRARDFYLCQICIRKLYPYGGGARLQYDDLSVHHARPLKDRWKDRLENENLITLCSVHHEMAERGEIPLEVIEKVIREQENSA